MSVSRGREACKVYVDSKDDVRDAIAKRGERLTADQHSRRTSPATGRAVYLPRASGIAEQRAEAFLLEMPVVCEDLGDPALPHRVHRNAIRQAVAFVQTHTVQIQPG